MSKLTQGSPEWLAVRKNKIGASDAPVIMGVSPWTTPYQLWTYKMGLAEPEMNGAMQRGLDNENQAREAFNAFIGVFTAPKVFLEDDIYPFMMASLDGVSEFGKTTVEIKCPGIIDHATALAEKIPEKYFPQLQHQLYMTGLPSMWYWSYRSPTEYACVKVERDDAYIERMIAAEVEFYRRMVEFDPPPLTDRDYKYMGSNDDWCKAALQYQKAVSSRKFWENQEEYARKTLILLSEGQNCFGTDYKLTKYYRKGAVEFSKIPELEKVDLEKYRKPMVESYRITEIGNEV